MIKLFIHNSTCRISGLSQAQWRGLRSLMTYQVDEDVAFFSGAERYYLATLCKRGKLPPPTVKAIGKYLGRRPMSREETITIKKLLAPGKHRGQCLLSRRGEFPTGLLYIVEKYLQEAEYELVDSCREPRLKQLGLETLFRDDTSVVPRPEQTDAACAALEYGRGIIVAPTGAGKSLIAALVCDAFQVKTLIVTHRLGLEEQMTAGLRELFGSERVGPLVNGRCEYFITVENVDALSVKTDFTGVDLLIIDEFHHAAAKTYRELNEKAWNNIYFRIGLTATPFRAKDEERLLLESVLSQVIYQITYKQAVEAGYIVPMEVFYVDVPKKAPKEDFYTYDAAYKEFITGRTDRNELIAQLLNNLSGRSLGTLCLVKEVAHGKALAELCPDTPFMKGENDNNSELFAAFNAGGQALIATLGVCGEGRDTKPCEHLLLTSPVKSKIQFMQALGRASRRFANKTAAKIILFRDSSHKYFLKAWRAQMKILKEEYGVTKITKINIDYFLAML